MAKAWEELKPLYEQLHAYVRAKLIERHERQTVKKEHFIRYDRLLADMAKLLTGLMAQSLPTSLATCGRSPGETWRTF